MRNKKILVTGGAGFIGTNLIKYLVQKGHTVTSLDNYSYGSTENHIPEVEYINKDVTEIVPQDLIGYNFDIVYHLAALSRIQPSFNEPVRFFNNNSSGTLAICEAVRYTNAKLVYAGSSSRWHNPYQSPYAASKHVGEEICKTYKQTYGLNIEIARFYNVYGPYELLEGEMAAVIGKFRFAKENNQPLQIVGNGEQRRDFTHVDDIVDGLWRIGMKQETHTDAWELGTGKNYSINEIAAMFKHPVEHIPDQLGNYRVTLQENTDAQRRLKWKPVDRVKDYIESLIN